MTDPAPPSDAAAPPPVPGKRSGLLRWVLRLSVALAVLLVAAVLFRNSLIRAGMEAAVTRVTGFPFTVDSFSLGLLDARVEIEGMRLSNPPGFENPRCLDIPRIVAQVELGSLGSEELHLPEIVLDLREVVVVRNAAGETNLDRLAALGKSGDGAKAGEEQPKEAKEAKEAKDPGSGEPAPGRRWRIDRLELTIGRVILLDYTRARNGKPKEEVWDLGVDHEEFRDLDSPDAVVRLIVLKVLKGTPIRLVNATVDQLTGALGKVVGGTAGAVGGIVGGAADAVGGGVKGVGGAVKGLLGGDEEEDGDGK